MTSCTVTHELMCTDKNSGTQTDVHTYTHELAIQIDMDAHELRFTNTHKFTYIDRHEHELRYTYRHKLTIQT